ncbi:MAG: hypothetical protein ACXVB1_10785 [Pseudobdellovibrionaceae bacterium]
MKLKYQLPRIYEDLLPREVLQMEPLETKATCDNCIMAKPLQRGKIFYKPELKCCTFYPFLPNYIVGAILSQESLSSSSALAAIRRKIAQDEYSLPLGLVAPPNYQVPYNHRKQNEFGQKEEWLCPYFNQEQKNCGIWRQRGAVCSSFYCKSSYGNKGLKFWEELSNYLTYVEMALMEESLVMLDFSPRQISDLLNYLNRQEATKSEMKSSRMAGKKSRELWNGYYGDQETFFKKCFQIVVELDKKSFRDLLGEQGKQLEDRLKKAFEKICL